MFLYSMTLQRPTCIVNAVAGNFSGTKQQEVVMGRGTVLELFRLDPSTGKLFQMLSINVFGVIRTITPIRLTGSSKDYIVIGSDSGRITILEYCPERNVFDKIHEETFGKSGCRRIVPGQYLAVDPKGRAVMIASVEKQKLVYILNRDQKARLTISSPLEAHKSHAILFHVVGLDVGFENPIFACLELDYTEADEDPTQEALQEARQQLVYYQLDLGLNHVVRQQSESLDDIANCLVAVPGGNDGPGGVIVCVENFVLYKNMGEQKEVRVPIPRRENDTDMDRNVVIVATATIKSKQILFFLLQTEYGDLFKLTLVVDDDVVTDMTMQYFDTTPVAASLAMMRNGFLFCASEFGSHFLYQISHLGQDSDEIFTSASLDEETVRFKPHPLANLIQFAEMPSLSPAMDFKVAQGAEETDVPQLYMSCGRGTVSSFTTLRHGLEVMEMAVSELPGSPNAIWTVKRNIHDEYDAFIVVSFVNATLVLSIGENVEEVTDSGFLATTPTLSASTLGDDSLMQIYADGVRHIRPDKRVNEWKTPGKAAIGHTAVNNRQVAITLNGNELIYFELDATGHLNEYTERFKTESEITCLAIGKVPENRQRSRYLAVGCMDSTVQIISLDPEDCLERLAVQTLPAVPSSLCLAEMDEGVEVGDQATQFLTIGLENGVMLRTVVDPVTGSLSDTRTRYLGSRSVKLFCIRMQTTDSVLALCSQSWLQYPYQGRILLTPLSYEPLDFASSFSSAQCPEGVVAISGNTLRIISMEKLGVSFNQTSHPLKYTPRKFVVHPESNVVVAIQTDYGVQSQTPGADNAMDTEDSPIVESFGIPRAAPGSWAGQIVVLDPSTNEVTHTEICGDNECPVSIAAVQFHGQSQSFILVGTAKDLELRPRGCSEAFIYTYKLVDNATRLELVHKTPVDHVPGALCAFQGRALAGVGRLLRIYDLGKRKLLRKCENKNLSTYIVHIMTMGTRIYVGDLQESWQFLKYKADTNQLVIFADDVSPRWITTGCVLDYNTVAGADKFGNFHVLRMPPNGTDDIDEDPSGAKVLWTKGLLGGAPQKLDCLAEYHVGDTIMSMQKVTLIPGGGEGIVYATIGGMIGMMAPFTNKDDAKFFSELEMHMEQQHPPLCGRDHLHYRSYYFPRKAVIDGDLVEQFNILPMAKKKAIAMELDRTPAEVSKRLEDMRSRFAL